MLQVTAAELQRATHQVNSAASQVSSSSQSLANGCSEQAASLQETSATSEEISSLARKNADHGRAAAELMAQSQGKIVQTNQFLGPAKRAWASRSWPMKSATWRNAPRKPQGIHRI
jgi:methyl-accepting chemotaxis protein/methyl-accepting chemotaxis protein-1 (serine sensor receptor)